MLVQTFKLNISNLLCLSIIIVQFSKLFIYLSHLFAYANKNMHGSAGSVTNSGSNPYIKYKPQGKVLKTTPEAIKSFKRILYHIIFRKLIKTGLH
jgi:hypothetical protein